MRHSQIPGILASVKIFTTESLRLTTELLRLTTELLRLEYGHLTPAEPYYLLPAQPGAHSAAGIRHRTFRVSHRLGRNYRQLD